jgi:hypothetical protein
MGGRAVDCTALEMRHTFTGIGGSNPSPSAKFSHKRLNLLRELALSKKPPHSLTHKKRR